MKNTVRTDKDKGRSIIRVGGVMLAIAIGFFIHLCFLPYSAYSLSFIAMMYEILLIIFFSVIGLTTIAWGWAVNVVK